MKYHFLFLIIIFFYPTKNLLQAQGVKRSVVKSIKLDSTFSRLNETDFIAALNLSEGGSFTKRNKNRAIQNGENYMRQMGFIYGRIKDIQTKYNSDSSFVDLKVIGNPGYPVRVGFISINSDSIAAQNYENLLQTRQYDTFSELSLEDDISNMLGMAADSGYVFARAEVSKIEIVREDNNYLADINLNIEEGSPVIISDVAIKGNNYTKTNVILREIPVSRGDIYDRTEFAKIPSRLLRMGIFEDVKAPTVLANKNGKYILSVELSEGNATTFDGIIGYIPENTKTTSSLKSTGYFTGLVDISFRNLFGTARSFDVHWEKPDRDSENFFMRYTEPWILDYPLDVSFGLERTVRDSTYIEWKGNLRNRWRYNRDFSLIGSFERQVVLPDSAANIDQRLVRYAQTNFELGIEYDTRDYPVNPRRGVFYATSYTFGLKENFGPRYLLQEDNIKNSEKIEVLKLGLKWYYEIFRNQVLGLHFTGNQVKGDRLQLTDYVWFGGARTLRGYRENQFRGDVTAWINLEYRFLLSRNSRIFVFNDWGVYHFKDSQSEIEEVLPGYGIGLRIDTALGIMAVDFGLGKGDSFSQAKIHFGIVNRF